MTGTFREGQYRFLIIFPSALLRMKNISCKSCKENQNIYSMFNNYLSKILPFMRECGKILQRGTQATDDNIPHARGMLDI
jgi:hypothetical protein